MHLTHERGLLIETIAPDPTASIMTKVRHSVKDDAKIHSIVKLEPPYLGMGLVDLEHNLKDSKVPGKKRYAGGGIGKVKKVYHKGQLIGALKIFTDSNRKRNAINEVRYNRLLKRESIWGEMNNKCYVLSPWIEGMNLHEYCQHLQKHAQDPAYKLPFQLPPQADYYHLGMIKNYFRQAKIFHDLELIIKDPKTSNAMVNFSKETIEILDFDAIHPIGKVINTHTRMYLPPDLISLPGSAADAQYTQADDIYIFGLMIAELFPQIFTLKFTEKSPTVISETKQSFQISKDLITLVNSMTHPERAKRPSIRECIDSLEKILAMNPLILPVDDKKVDEIDQLSQEIEIEKQAVIFKDLCSYLKNPAHTDKAAFIANIYPKMLNELMPDSLDTLLMFAITHKRMPIIEIARVYALKNNDHATINLLLSHGLFDNLEKALIDAPRMLLLALEIKEEKTGVKEKLIEKLLGDIDISDSKNTEILALSKSATSLCLFKALRDHDYARFIQILEKSDTNIINMTSMGGSSLLSKIFEIKYTDDNAEKALELLLKKGADLFSKNKSGQYVLHMAKELNNKRVDAIIQAHLKPLLKLADFNFDELYDEKDIIKKFQNRFNEQHKRILNSIKIYEEKFRNPQHIVDFEEMEDSRKLYLKMSRLREKCEKIEFDPKNIYKSFQNLSKIVSKFFKNSNLDQIKKFLSEKNQHCYATIKLIADQLVADIDARINKYQARHQSRGNKKTKNKLDSAQNLRLCFNQIKIASHTQDKTAIESLLDSDDLRNRKQEFASAAKAGILFGKSFSVNDQAFIAKFETDLEFMKIELESLKKIPG